MIPLPHAIQLLEHYIMSQKGLRVKVAPPRTEEEIRLFEKAVNFAMTYSGL